MRGLIPSFGIKRFLMGYCCKSDDKQGSCRILIGKQPLENRGDGRLKIKMILIAKPTRCTNFSNLFLE